MLLTLPAAISLFVFGLAVYMGVSSAWIGLSMNSPRERMQAVIAFSAAWYALAEVPLTLDTDDFYFLAGMRLQLVGAAIHAITWLRYAHLVRFHGVEDPPPISRIQRVYEVVILVLAIACSNPDWSYYYEISYREITWLHAVYRDALPTPLNEAVFTLLLLGVLGASISFARSALMGVREARANFVAVFLLFLTGTFDTLTVMGLFEAPYILSLGFFVSVCISWAVITQRFVRQARSTESTSLQLAETVQTRTAALNRTHEELQRAERLAGLGRLAAGVAHEINNPAAVAISNMEFVIEEIEEGSDDKADLIEALRRGLRQMRRVEGIVSDMLASGRIAGSRDSMNENSGLLSLVTAAIESEDLTSVTLTIDIPETLTVVGGDQLLFPIVRNLVANARDAVVENQGGTIIMGTAEVGQRVLLTVQDDGGGMTPDVAKRIFEPFFTTKAPGKGTGMGLSVSLGMVRTVGGDLTCDSVPGEGTTMTLSLFKPRPSGHTPIPILRAVK